MLHILAAGVAALIGDLEDRGHDGGSMRLAAVQSML